MNKFCECKCGQVTKIHRGKYNKFIRGHNNNFKIGHKINNNRSPWNKGLTKETDDRVKTYCDKLTSERRSDILKSAHKNMSKEKKILRNQRIGNGNRGKKLSKETKQKISKVNKGKKLSKEHKIKISNSHKGTKNHFYGKHHTKETISIIREANKNKKMSDTTKNKIRIKTLEKIKKIGGPRIGGNETKILNQLEYKLGYKIIRQYEIIGYFLDGYVPELNLAIEIDEKKKFNSNNILRQKHINRQKNIEKELICNFLRIKDFK